MDLNQCLVVTLLKEIIVKITPAPMHEVNLKFFIEMLGLTDTEAKMLTEAATPGRHWATAPGYGSSIYLCTDKENRLTYGDWAVVCKTYPLFVRYFYGEVGEQNTEAEKEDGSDQALAIAKRLLPSLFPQDTIVASSLIPGDNIHKFSMESKHLNFDVFVCKNPDALN